MGGLVKFAGDPRNTIDFRRLFLAKVATDVLLNPEPIVIFSKPVLLLHSVLGDALGPFIFSNADAPMSVTLSGIMISVILH